MIEAKFVLDNGDGICFYDAHLTNLQNDPSLKSNSGAGYFLKKYKKMGKM